MFIKLIITLAIMLVMAGPLPINSQSMKDSVSDKEIEIMATIIDRAVVSYYVSHAGLLPDRLDENVLLIMGLNHIDLSPFSYEKTGDNTFKLTARLTNSTLTSVNSDKELIEIEPVAQ